MTAGLMVVITAVATNTRVPTPLAASAIGATVALSAMWGGPISGASMNPIKRAARAIEDSDIPHEYAEMLRTGAG